MNLGTNKNTFKIDKTTLDNVEETKFLGITLDKKFNFNKHFTNIRNECIPRLTLLRTLKEKYSISTKKLTHLYKAILRSKIEYSFLPLLVTNKKKLKKKWKIFKITPSESY